MLAPLVPHQRAVLAATCFDQARFVDHAHQATAPTTDPVQAQQNGRHEASARLRKMNVNEFVSVNHARLAAEPFTGLNESASEP
jgi:hypothetical protein